MKTEKINGHSISFYDSIDYMPISVFHQYNKYLLIDSGIGSDMESVNEHFTRLYKYISTGNKKDGIQELDNMRQNLMFIVENLSPKFMAGACLIYSIDGEVINDRSEDGIKHIIEKIEKIGLKTGKFANIISDIKKKTPMN